MGIEVWTVKSVTFTVLWNVTPCNLMLIISCRHGVTPKQAPLSHASPGELGISHEYNFACTSTKKARRWRSQSRKIVLRVMKLFYAAFKKGKIYFVRKHIIYIAKRSQIFTINQSEKHRSHTNVNQNFRRFEKISWTVCRKRYFLTGCLDIFHGFC